MGGFSLVWVADLNPHLYQGSRKALAFWEKEKHIHLEQSLEVPNGESGIRTHAPLRTNGFQDRLVMTTSIPLHVRLERTQI